MTRPWSPAARRLTALPRWAWRRRRAVALLLLVSGTAAAVAGWGYARYQWRSALHDLAADRPADARTRLAVPLRLWAYDPDVHLMAARAARVVGDLPAADIHLAAAKKAAGGATPAVQLEYLLLRVQTGELDAVAPTLIAAADAGHPDAPLMFETLAVAYMVKLRYNPAYACLSRWLELAPNTPKALQYRGWTLERLNLPKAARADYDRALELDPDLIPVRIRVAELLLEDHRTEEAEPHLDHLMRQAPADPVVRARMGVCRYGQGRHEEARRLLEAAAPFLPTDPTLHIHLARLDAQDGKHAEAERRLRTVYERDGSDTEALFALVTAVRAQGRTAEADALNREYDLARARVTRIHALLKENADRPAGTAADYAELGELLLLTGQEQKGEYWLFQALEREPGNQVAHRALADRFEKAGDPDRAAVHRRQLRDPAAAGAKP